VKCKIVKCEIAEQGKEKNRMGFNDNFRARTKAFALRVIKLFRALPRTDEARILGKQLLRTGTSVGANFRAATRARSKADSFLRLQSWPKKLMNPLIGWNY